MFWGDQGCAGALVTPRAMLRTVGWVVLQGWAEAVQSVSHHNT